MKHAAGGERDAVLKAGNEFADKATPATEAIKKPLGDYGGFLHHVAGEEQRGYEWREPVDEPTMR